MTIKSPVTLGDVAYIRALARQVKMLGTDDIEQVKKAISDEFSGEFSNPMVEMLMALTDPEIVDDLCNLAIMDLHTTGEI